MRHTCANCKHDNTGPKHRRTGGFTIVCLHPEAYRDAFWDQPAAIDGSEVECYGWQAIPAPATQMDLIEASK
jgi:hypothetical protein